MAAKWNRRPAWFQHPSAAREIEVTPVDPQDSLERCGIGIDSSRSSIHVSNIDLHGGASAANAPEVLVLMRKTEVLDSDASGFFFDAVTFKTFGKYELYDYGSEIMNVNNCMFFGESFSCVDLVTLSAVNSAGILSLNATLGKPRQSMAAVNFTGHSTFEATGGQLSSQVQNAVVFDEGNQQVTGGIADISFAGTTFLLCGPYDVALTDPVGATGPVSHISLVGVRVEGNGETQNQLINLHTLSQSLGWTITGEWGSSGQTIPEMQFAEQLGGSWVNWNSRDTGTMPTAPSIEAGSGNGTTAIIQNGSSNPIEGSDFSYTANGSSTYNDPSLTVGVLNDPTPGNPALYLNGGIDAWKEAEANNLVIVPTSSSPYMDAKTGNILSSQFIQQCE